MKMKNIQVIDGADNCTYSIYGVTDEEFSLLFPAEGQNIEFIEDIIIRIGEDKATQIFKEIWARSIRKTDVFGIHGTIFFELEHKKKYYPTKREDEMIVVL